MTKRPLFKLSPRLKICADFVNAGSKIVDIGTDHAYLPIWLAKSGKIRSAIASDLREGPLKSAASNIEKYKVSDKVKVRLSNGFSNIDKNEFDIAILAGMGGNLIYDIISKSPWLKDKTLILQPMTSAFELREFLYKEKYFVNDERAIYDEGKVYTVMFIDPTSKNPEYNGLYPYIGLLHNNMDNDARKYIEKEIIHLNNKIKGLEAIHNYGEANALNNVISKLKTCIEKGCPNDKS